MGVQRNQEGGKNDNRPNDGVSIAIDQKHKAQEQARSIGEQFQQRVLRNRETTVAQFRIHHRTQGNCCPLQRVTDRGRQIHLTHVKILTYSRIRQDLDQPLRRVP